MKVHKDTMHLDFSISKVEVADFTQKEIDEFMDAFIELVESKDYSAGGGFGYYVEDELEIEITKTGI